MKNEIKYVGFYDVLREGKQYRVYSLAAAKKMDYICHELSTLGYKVRIVSPSYVTAKGNKKIERKSHLISDACCLELPPSCEANNKISRVIRVLQSRVWLFTYLLKNTKRNEKVLVYHNYSLALPVILAQKIKGFDVVLEVEEIYSKVWKLSCIQRWKEKILLKYADENCLVVSEVLAEELKLKKPAVSYGSYMICDKPHRSVNDGTIKLILTGSVDKERGNGFLAVEAMKYLPSQYKLFISGSVVSKDREEFLELIKKTNADLGRDACVYLGLLDEEKYEQLLLSADIALNPQKEGEFGKYVFPSKILTYLGHGLPVVSTRGKSIEKSSLSDVIVFSDGYDGESIAKAVENVTIKKADYYYSPLENLQIEFANKLEDIFGKVEHEDKKKSNK